MSHLNLYQEQNRNMTSISNYFIDNYMEDANDAQIKIYIYLMRMSNAGIPVGISDIADKFSHTEKNVIRSLKYWEEKRVLALESDAFGNISGIRFLKLNAEVNEVPSDNRNTELAPIVPLPSAEQAKNQSDIPTKTTYTRDQVSKFKDNEDIGQLIFISEQYLAKSLSSSDLQSLFYIYDKLKLSIDLIDYLIQYCVGKGKREFRYIEKVAIAWKEEGITTPAQAKETVNKYDKSVYTIMKALGKTTAPTSPEVNFINKWTTTFGFTLDIITEACDRSVLAVDSHRFEYADSILTRWQKASVHTKADITAADSAYQQTRQKAPSASDHNKFNHFTQNQYDFAALENEIISN